MTFQPPPPPPPPPPAGPPPGGPPGAWGPPPGGQPPGAWGPPQGGRTQGPSFDPKSVNQFDWGILGLGGLTFIFSFFSYYSLSAGPYSDSAGAWHFSSGSFIAWFAMVFTVVGAAAVGLELFAPQIKLPVPTRLAGLVLCAAGSVLYIIAIFAHPKFYDQDGISFGHGFSFWLSLVFSLALTGLSLMRVQQTGGKLPGALGNIPNIGGQHSGGPVGPPPQQGMQQGMPQGPPPGYVPPQGPPPGYGPPPGPPPGH